MLSQLWFWSCGLTFEKSQQQVMFASPSCLCSWQPMTVCVCVCAPHAWMCLRLPVSLTRLQPLTQRGDNQKRQRLHVVTSTATTPRNGARSAATSPPTFSPQHRLHTSPSLPSLSPTTLSLPVIAAHLPASSSAGLVCQPASGLRRPASFIKRKQAGGITRDAGIWGQLICWQHRWGSAGWSAENEPEIYRLRQESSPQSLVEAGILLYNQFIQTTEPEKGCRWAIK